mgnify:CR=1 FL=1
MSSNTLSNLVYLYYWKFLDWSRNSGEPVHSSDCSDPQLNIREPSGHRENLVLSRHCCWLSFLCLAVPKSPLSAM